jgi:hypothetical protein
MAGVALAAALMTGCGCAAIATHKHQLLSHPAPSIQEPKDIAKALLPNMDNAVSCFGRASGFFFTTFKRMGIRGWRDLRYDGTVTGIVSRPPVKSTDQFLTVDLQVETLEVGGSDVSAYARGKYLRAEICLREVDWKRNEWPAKGAPVTLSGRMVWDGDPPHGFVEIHPRNRGEVH